MDYYAIESDAKILIVFYPLGNGFRYVFYDFPADVNFFFICTAEVSSIPIVDDKDSLLDVYSRR